MNVQERSWWDFRAAFYLFSAISLLALRLVATNWVEDINVFVSLALMAVILGLAFGVSHFKAWWVAILATGYGAIIIPWFFGLTLASNISWYDRIINLLWFRLRLTVDQYYTGAPITDPILFITILAILIWSISFFAGYILTRRASVWAAILPPGLVLIVISHYDQVNPETEAYVLFFSFFVLLLIGRVIYLRNDKSWGNSEILPPPQVEIDIRRALLIITVSILAFSWLIPLTSTQVEKYAKFWDSFNRLFEPIRTRITKVIEPLQSYYGTQEGGFGTTLKLGNRISLGTSTLFTVETTRPHNPSISNYWKAQSYDLYSNDQWAISNGYDKVYLFPQSFDLTHPEWLSRDLVTVNFDIQIPQESNIYIPNAQVWVSRSIEAFVRSVDNQQDVISIFAYPSLQPGENYEAQALVGMPTRVELRESGDVYPDWLGHYLQLPADLPSSIRQFALEITRDLNNPYDRTLAITSYLRENIEYSDSLPPLPEGEDPIEWFLFTHKAGFCNYYATAQILMLRSVGVPARLAVGYAQGEFDRITGRYTVRQKDRHAWPEVYFNEYGWIEFEPTSAMPRIERPIGESRPLPLPEIGQPIMDDEEPALEALPPQSTLIAKPEVFVPIIQPVSGSLISLVWLGILMLTMVTAIFVWWLATPQVRAVPFEVNLANAMHRKGIRIPHWLEQHAKNKARQPYNKAYHILAKSIKRLGQHVNPAETPTERGNALRKLMPELSEHIDILVHQYELENFSLHDADLLEVNASRLIILKQVQLLLVKRLLSFKSRSPYP